MHLRFILLSSLLLLAGCNADPAKLGITGGATVAEPPADPGEVQTGIPGAPQSGHAVRR